MTWRCKNCKCETEYDEKSLIEKGNPVCPECGNDMEALYPYPFVVNSDDHRIVHEFEVDAIDEDEADTLANKELEDFISGLSYERQ